MKEADGQYLTFGDLGYVNNNNQYNYKIFGKCIGEGGEIAYIVQSKQSDDDGGSVLRQRGATTCQMGRWEVKNIDLAHVSEATEISIEAFLDRVALEQSTAFRNCERKNCNKNVCS